MKIRGMFYKFFKNKIHRMFYGFVFYLEPPTEVLGFDSLLP